MTIKTLILKYIKTLLIIGLPLMIFFDAYNTIKPTKILDNTIENLLFLSIINGLILLFFNYTEIKTKLTYLVSTEKEPIVSNKQFKKNTIIILLLLCLFTVPKIFYFNNSFALNNVNTLKYNSYVEPAMHMAKHNDPFWFQKKYRANPINNPEGIIQSFDQLPLMEWVLFASYKIFTFNSIEFNTRLIAHLSGLFILIFAYLFLKNWFSKTQTFIIIFLMAINPLISYSTFLTVYDSWLIMFTFTSLFLLDKFYQKKHFKYLFWAGLMFGIGNACKYSLFLWLAPISFFVIFFHESQKQNYQNNQPKNYIFSFLKTYFIYIFLALLPIFTNHTSIIMLPTKTTKGLLLFAIWIFLYILLYLFLNKFQNKITNIISNLYKNKTKLILLIFILTIIIYYFLTYTQLLDTTSKTYITNLKLIFYLPLYNQILLTLTNQITSNVFYLGILGFIFIFLIKKTDGVKLSFAIFFSSIIYLVIAAKTIFFHPYYLLVFTILLNILASYAILAIYKTQNTIFKKTCVVILILLSIFPKSYYLNIKNISQERDGFKEAVEYLIENSKENDLYINEGSLVSLVLKTGRGRVGDINDLNNATFKNSIKQIGFSQTMEKYNIKYLIISRREQINYNSFAILFSEEMIPNKILTKKDIIFDVFDPSYEFYDDLDKRKNIIQKYNIPDKFKLEKKIGYYSFYSFKD
jgi:4-amino-4-deoxy-L-arabinose transferase-like glycosyltransferase